MSSRYPYYAAWLAALSVLALTIAGGAAYPNYSHASQFISELGAKGAPHEYLVRFGGFLPAGVFCCVYVFSAFRRLPSSGLTTLSLVGVFLFALGYLAAVFFPCDPGCRPVNPSVSQLIHNLFGLVGYLAAPVFLFIFGSQSRLWPGRGFLPAIAYACASASLIGLLTLNPESPWVGISQRLIETSVWLWIVLSARYMVNGSSPRPSRDERARL